MVYDWTMPVGAIGSKAFLALDTSYLWHLWYGYFGILLLLMLRAIYLYRHLLRHIYKRYPEQGKVLRSYEWQRYPWSKGARLLRALIMEESVSDPQLAHRAKKADHSGIYFFVWLALGLIVFFVSMLLFLVR
jgi:hypothetical protein